MEVLVGPSFTIDVPPSPPAAYDGGGPIGGTDEHAVPSCLFLSKTDGVPGNNGSGFRFTGPHELSSRDSSESSSSIGTPDDSEAEEEEEEEVHSTLKGRNGLGSLDSLEDSLPIKRGLSSHFDGKSKSFTDLSQISSLKELQKQESPFNKRRRVLIASKWSKRSFYSWSNPKSMPLLRVDEDQDEDADYEYEQEKVRKIPSASSSSSSTYSLSEEKKQDQVPLRRSRVPESYATEMRLRLGSFKSRSFSLADLQERDDEEEDDG